MSKLRVNCFSISFDGYSAGPDQSLENPLGVGAMPVFNWVFATQAQHKMFGKPGGETGLDNDLVNRGFENVGAWILGRNMFGPIRGPWLDDAWKGWWGDNPPYHVPVFVLTHHARAPLTMEGGTTFHFVTDGIHSALQRAIDAAQGKDVRLGGGASTIQQYLRAGLIDELHLVSSPVLIGSGESIFRGLDLPALGYEITSHTASPAATHMFLEKKK
ncbi:MAG: dihydrofolate reductase family protein [Acidobacteriaceae bacterium]